MVLTDETTTIQREKTCLIRTGFFFRKKTSKIPKKNPKILEIVAEVLPLQSVSQKSGVFGVACFGTGGLFKRKAFFERFT